MKFNQPMTHSDLLAAAQMERYQDMLRAAEMARQLQGVEQEQSAPTASLIERLRQWISTPPADQPVTTTELKAA